MYLIDHLGRIKLLIIGAVGGLVCIWIVGAYIKLHGTSTGGSDQLPPGGIAAIFLFYL